MKRVVSAFIALIALSTIVNAQEEIFKDCPECPEMVQIPGGVGTIGSPKNEIGRDPDEDQHEFSIESFAIAIHEVTIVEFTRFMDETGYRIPSCMVFGTDGWYMASEAAPDSVAPFAPDGTVLDGREAMGCVSYDAAIAYIDWLNSQAPGKNFRLPTEIEWEYAARAGATSAYYWGDEPSDACRYANVGDASLRRFRPSLAEGFSEAFSCDDGATFMNVRASYEPNGFGLYDMTGNVSEWTSTCVDDYRKYIDLLTIDMMTSERPGSCMLRIHRGGGHASSAKTIRMANRLSANEAYAGVAHGFRLVRDMD